MLRPQQVTTGARGSLDCLMTHPAEAAETALELPSEGEHR